MKNKDLILFLIDKSANAFGELIGITEEAKLKVALTIIQDAIKTALEIDSNLLTPKVLEDILVKNLLDIDQTILLSNLLWIKAKLLLKLNRPIESLTNYENALLVLQWEAQQTVAKKHLEKQNEITELNAAIDELKLTRNKLNYN